MNQKEYNVMKTLLWQTYWYYINAASHSFFFEKYGGIFFKIFNQPHIPNDAKKDTFPSDRGEFLY